MCHDDVAEIYTASLHGKLVEAGARLAPRCWDCHGAHDVLPSGSDSSHVTKFNIPFMCGRCHKEGTEVSRTYGIVILSPVSPAATLSRPAASATPGHIVALPAT